MKKITMFIISLTLFIFVAGLAMADVFYSTYEVVEVTENTIVLQNSAGYMTEIDKSRRPTLQVGDKVRYDTVRNVLGKTVDEKKESSKAGQKQ